MMKKLFLFIFCAALAFSSVTYAKKIRLILEDYEAILYMKHEGQAVKAGKAKWNRYEDGFKFRATVNTQDRVFDGPFTVFLNEKKVGKTQKSEQAHKNGTYIYHRFELKTENGDDVPPVKDGDFIKLKNPKNPSEFVMGKFIPD